MPTYDYVCTKCGHEFELFQKMSDEPRKRCPKCRGTVRRLIGAGAGLLFKGDGFYTTDYRSKDYREKAKADQEAPKKPEKSKESTPVPKESKTPPKKAKGKDAKD